MSKKARTSSTWTYFVVKDESFKIAKCDLCGQELNFKTTISNLKKHLERRHPTVNLNVSKTPSVISQPEPCPGTSASTLNVSIVNPSYNTNATETHTETPTDIVQKSQSSIRSFLPAQKKISEVQKKKLDNLLMRMFVYDYQPFTIVEDKGFVDFVNGLNPSYKLPNRKTITKTMLPGKFEQCFNAVRNELQAITSVCLSTDCWTSVNMESYLAVTAHYITDQYELRSILLECSCMSVSHTSVNLADAIKVIISKFHLNDKILVIVSDNANNIKAAVANELKMKHFGCFAHTINLILQDALKIPKELIEKIKTVVNHFKRSSISLEKLVSVQKSMGLEPKKLLQEVSTRWNSTFYMIERYFHLKDAIKATIALINKDLPVLSEEEWEICNELCVVLGPFEEVTKQISGGKYITGSLVIPLSNGLKSVCEQLDKEMFSTTTKRVVSALLSGIDTRLGNMEYSKTLALATLLDPRFKLAPFCHELAGNSAKENCQSLMAAIWSRSHKDDVTNELTQEVHNIEATTDVSAEMPKKYSVWGNLDKKISTKKTTGNLYQHDIT